MIILWAVHCEYAAWWQDWESWFCRLHTPLISEIYAPVSGQKPPTSFDLSIAVADHLCQW